MASFVFIPDLVQDPRPQLPLSAPSARTPATLDMRDLVLRTENQGSSSMCAAYTATSWLESIEWRRTGVPLDRDPKVLYARAKDIDGLPAGTNGTTLAAVMQAMADLGWVKDRTADDVRFFYDAAGYRTAIHRYGTALLGFNIGAQWSGFTGLDMTRHSSGVLGGHAVTGCGYDRKGIFLQNSWGDDWGSYGFCRMAWDVFEKEFSCGAVYRNMLDGMED